MTFRRATAADAGALRDLERAANLVALAHVFPPERSVFPDAAVLQRWTAALAEPGVVVEVVDAPGGGGGLAAYAAYDATVLRHLAVHPDRWGTGLARAAVERAAAAIRAGDGTPRLWCLELNTRAAGLYRHLGWEPTAVSRPTAWPSEPVEQEWTLPGAAP